MVRYQDGKILKGQTSDFLPVKPIFHISLIDSSPGDIPLEVQVSGLKAIFFVKDFMGNSKHKKVNEFTPGKSVGGRKISVAFKDGETIVGTTQGYDPKRPGFFIVPADMDSNNERCFIVANAVKDVSFI